MGAQMVSATDGSGYTSPVTWYYSGDGGGQTIGATCTHAGLGYHYASPSQGQTNYDHIAFTFTGASAVPVTVQVYTYAMSVANETLLNAGASGLVYSTCTAGSSVTEIRTNLTEATNDHYNGRTITFLSGALAGQSSDITDYVGSTKYLTVTALTEAPANTDSFVIS